MHCISESVIKGFCSAVSTNVYETRRRMNTDHFMSKYNRKISMEIIWRIIQKMSTVGFFLFCEDHLNLNCGSVQVGTGRQ